MEIKQIVRYLNLKNSKSLFQEADRIRKAYCKDYIHLRGIIEFSNYCQRNCLYCGLRRANRKLPRYRMNKSEILKSAKAVSDLGYKTIVLQSGEDDFYSIDFLCELIKAIKKKYNCALTLSLGEKKYSDYRKLKEAGADRYLLKFETSNLKLFRRLKPGSSFKQRIKQLAWLKKLNFQVGSGIIVGLPGQNSLDLAKDIKLIESLDLDMVGIGPFIRHPDTPLCAENPGSLGLTLKVIALVRLITKNTHIPATTAVGSIASRGLQQALKAGANVLMPNVTLAKYRPYYEIYPGKIIIGQEASEGKVDLARILKQLKRSKASGRGDSLKKPKNK